MPSTPLGMLGSRLRVPWRLSWRRPWHEARHSARLQMLAIGVAAVLLQGVIVHTALTGLSGVRRAHDDYSQIVLAQRAFQDADMAHDAMHADLLAVLLESAPTPPGAVDLQDALREVDEEVGRYRTALRGVDAVALQGELARRVVEVRGQQEAFAEDVVDLARLADTDPAAARRGLRDVVLAYDRLTTSQQGVTDAMAREATQLQARAEEGERRARVRLLVAALVTLLGLLGLTYLLSRLAAALALLVSRQRSVVELLQRSLLPDVLPDLPGVDLAVRYLPGADGAQVGGDWYDVVRLPGGEVGLVMGDVVGHDLHAATEMGQLRSALRAYAADGLPPEQVLQRLNRLCTQQEPVPMATVLYAVLDPVERTLVMANAGHCPPLLLDADGCRLLELPAHPPVGAVREVEYTSVLHHIPDDPLLVLYTDGLVERRGLSLDDGLARLCDVAGPRGVPLEQVCERLVADMLDDAEPEDDIALMLVAPRDRLGDHLDLEWEASVDRLAALRRVLSRWLAEAGADEDESFDIVLSCGEAATNAVEHAYGPSRAQFRMVCDVSDSVVTVLVRDWGRWRPPRGSDRGRGLTLMQALMDEATVHHGADGTEVRMCKRLAGAARS